MTLLTAGGIRPSPSGGGAAVGRVRGVCASEVTLAQPNERRASVLALLVLVVFGAALVASAHTRATVAFGNSHDGRNAGVWASASRSLRERGPVASRLGTRSIVGDETTPYATHPPLIVLETAAAEAVLGEHPWVSRLPAWGGTLAALALGWSLLRACRLRPLAASIGVALGFGCPMVAVYGTMLDTPIVGLPFGIAVLLAWQRARTGHPAPTAVVAAVTALAVLSSWQGLLAAALVTLAVVVPRLRHRTDSVPVTGYLLGTLGGGVALTAWIAWAYGSLGPLLDQLVFRTGSGREPVGPRLLISALRTYWPGVLTPWLLLLGIPALLAAVRHPATRAVGTMSLAVVGIWIVGLRDGAVHHDYWAYWIVLPLALGLGAMADVGLDALLRRKRNTLPALLAVATGAAALAGAGAWNAGITGAAVGWGAEGGRVLQAAAYPPMQTTAWFLGDAVRPVSWTSYGAHRPAAELRTAADVDRLAASAPLDLVLVDVVDLRPDVRGPKGAAGCRAGVAPGHAFAIVRASVLAQSLAAPTASCLSRP